MRKTLSLSASEHRIMISAYFNRKNLSIIMTMLEPSCFSQYTVMDAVPATVNFEHVISPGDGFGFNYVETAQSIE